MKFVWEASFQNGLCFIHCEKDKNTKPLMGFVIYLCGCIKHLVYQKSTFNFIIKTQCWCYILSSK